MSRRCAPLLIGLTALASCGSDAATTTAPSSPPATTVDASSTTVAPAPPTTTAATTSAAPTTTAAATTTPATTAPPTTTPDLGDTVGISFGDEVFTSSEPAALTGDIEVGPTDLIVLHEDGDIWLHPGALGDDAGDPLRIVDNVDPRPEADEGPGPNVVDHVAGVFDGALIYSECCEPIAGSVLTTTHADADPVHVGFGYQPRLSPDGTRLSTANSFAIVVTDLLDATSTGRPVNTDDSRYVEVWDAIWSADGSTLIVLYADAEFALQRFDAATLVGGSAVSIGVEFDTVSAFDTLFAGNGPDGEVVVSARSADATTIRFFDDTTLVEFPELQRTLPSSVTSVRLGANGRDLLWVDGGDLWYNADGGEPRQLGSGHLAAWFAT